jgi:hypothetical protein
MMQYTIYKSGTYIACKGDTFKYFLIKMLFSVSAIELIRWFIVRILSGKKHIDWSKNKVIIWKTNFVIVRI